MSNNGDDGDDVAHHNRGSGLAIFFREYLPSTMTRRRRRRRRRHNNDDDDDDDDDDNDDVRDYDATLADMDEPTQRDLAYFSAQKRVAGVTFMNDEQFDFKRWRNLQKETLKEYIMKRMVPNDSQSGSGSSSTSDDNNEAERDDEGCSSEEVDDIEKSDEEQVDEQEIHHDALPETQPESQPETQPETQLETQPQTLLETQPESPPTMGTQEEQQQQTVPNSDRGGNVVSVSRRHNKKRKRPERKLIPNVNDTIHEVSKIEYLDLYTQILNVPLCRVVKVWGVRETKRAYGHRQSFMKPLPCLVGRLPRFPFHYKEEDGPIASIFKHVLSVEVVQLKLDPTGTTGASHQQQPSSPWPLRLRIFFYGKYATSIYQWMQKQRQDDINKDKRRKKTEFVMSLSSVPAKCIFPFAIDSRNWMDQTDLIEYCLCIGDKSFLKTQKDGTLYPMRFDSDNLNVSILATTPDNKNKNDTTEVGRTTSNNLHDIWSIRKYFPTEGSPSSLDYIPEADADENRLQQAWCAFNELQQKQHEYAEEDVTAAVSHLVQQVDPLLPRREEDHIVVLQQCRDPGNPNQSAGVRDPRPPRRDAQTAPGHLLVGHRSQQDILESMESTHQDQTILTDEPIVTEPLTVVGDAIRKTIPSRLDSYIKLGDLEGVMIDQKENGKKLINLYAVVVGCTGPRLTKRGDWVMTAVLIDETCTIPRTAVLFNKQEHKLPRLVCMGDILRIHRAGVEVWKGGAQIFGNKEASSYAVVRNSEAGWKVYPTSSSSFTFSESDVVRSQTLWHWARGWFSENATIDPERSFTLSEIPNIRDEDEVHFKDRDITVMVTGVYTYPALPNGVSPKGFLRVWDGTGFSPSDPPPVQTIVTQSVRGRGDPPSDAVFKVASIAQGLQASDSSMKIPKALCGRVANVVIWEDQQWSLVREHAPVGTFLRLRNVDVRRWQKNTFRSIEVHPLTWMTVLPDTNYEVRLLIEEHNCRVLRNDYNPASGLLPVTNLGDRLSAFVADERRGSYTGTVRILKPMPEIFTVRQLRQKLSIDDESHPAYPTGLVIGDLSGSMTVLVSGEARTSILELLPSVDAAPTPSNWLQRDDLFGTIKHCRVTIHSINMNDERYFVMTDLAPIMND